jgi:hypothetical protein
MIEKSREEPERYLAVLKLLNTLSQLLTCRVRRRLLQSLLASRRKAPLFALRAGSPYIQYRVSMPGYNVRADDDPNPF